MFPNFIRFSCVIFTVFSFRRRIDLLDFVRSVKTVVLGVFTAENPGWRIRRFQDRRTVYRSDDVKTQLTRIQPRTTVSLSEITLRYFPTNGCFDTKTTVSYNSIYIEHPQTTSINRSQHRFSCAQEMRNLKVGFSSVLARGVFCTFPLFPPFLFPLFDCSSNSNNVG